ncbi:transketolase [Elusimicrobiota bacterium]
MKIKKLVATAKNVRKLIIEAACRAKCPHVGPSLSSVELITACYFHELNINKSNWKNRDIFILSKGHGALGLYAVMAAKGLLSKKVFNGYFLDKGTLPGHLDRFTAKGIEASAGSLGHGFNMALGMAHGFKLKGDKRKVFALIGDGESEEGSVWEGAMFAAKLKIDNVTIILDRNNMQGYGRPTELCHYEPIADKWKAFGWQVYTADGHDFAQILKSFKKPNNGKPKIIIAKTVKGKGISFMEDELKWHYFIVTEELKNKALKELA